MCVGWSVLIGYLEGMDVGCVGIAGVMDAVGGGLLVALRLMYA